MKRRIVFALCFALTGFINLSLGQAVTPDFSSRVVYGDDNRLDYFQITDSGVKQLASSTAAFFQEQDLRASGDRVFFQSETYQEYQKLCSDQPFLNQPTAAFCSGALVAPNRILTAGHCVKTDEACATLRIGFDYRIESANGIPGFLKQKDVYACKRIIARKYYRTGIDYALIELDRPVLDRSPLKLNFEDSLTAGTDLSVLGFPVGLPLKLAEHARVRDIRSGFFVTNADTFGGNSGSPVFNPKTFAIEGVLVRGEVDFEQDKVRGCNIERHCSDTGCGGESATLASVLREPMQLMSPQPSIEEVTGFAYTTDGSGYFQAIIRVPFEFSNHKFSLRLDVYSRDSHSFETIQTVPVPTSSLDEQMKIESEFASVDPSDLALGAVRGRMTLLMDGLAQSEDVFSIFATEPF